MTNKALARHLKLAADLIELSGGNPFRARAYASAARAVERLEVPLADVPDPTAIPGIGKGLAAELRGLVATGRLEAADALLDALPPGLPGLLRVRGLGARKVRALWQRLGVTSLDELEAAAVSGRVAALEGFGARSAENLLEQVALLRAYEGRMHFARVLPEALAVREALRAAPGLVRADLAGALRRQLETLDRADFVAAGPAEVAAQALRDAGLADVTVSAEATGGGVAGGGVAGGGAAGGVFVTARLASGLPARVALASEASYGRVLFEATGSEAHVAAFRAAHGAPADVPDEDAVYAAAGLSPVPPPLREDTGELARAARGPFPPLVRAADLRGALHNHTTASDGAHTLAEMAEAARARGLGYFGVADHSQSLAVARGLSPERLRAQVADVRALNDAYAAEGTAFRVFSGSEVDILPDGTLDYADDLLACLDVVVASVHTHFGMTADEATERLVRAVANPHVAILGHPTGRLLLRREGYPIHAERVLDACAAHGVAVELNANPWRLDLDWRWLRGAAERGVPVAINPDAHHADELDNVRWGVAAAQKAGLEPADVLNARDAPALQAWLEARQR